MNLTMSGSVEEASETVYAVLAGMVAFPSCLVTVSAGGDGCAICDCTEKHRTVHSTGVGALWGVGMTPRRHSYKLESRLTWTWFY